MQQEQRLVPLRQQLVPLEPKRQQLVLELEQQLELVLQLELLFYRKRPGRKLQRWLPKRVICSFFDTLIYIRKQFLKRLTETVCLPVQAGEFERYQPNAKVYADLPPIAKGKDTTIQRI